MNNYETTERICKNFTITEFVGKNIFSIKGLLSEQECKLIISEMDEKMTYTYNNYGYGNNVQCHIANSIDLLSIKSQIIEKLVDVTLKMNEYVLGFNADSFSKIQLRRVYGRTREHSDGLFDSTAESQINYGIIKHIRAYTLVVTLNDDFYGGLYEFQKQNFIYKPAAGECLIFPPYLTHPHAVSLVNKHRYILSTWGLTNAEVVNDKNVELNNIIII